MSRHKKSFDQCISQLSYLVREHKYLKYCKKNNPPPDACYRYIILKNKQKYHMY